MRENTSLWSKYMMDRYCRGYHPISVPLANNATSVWKRMRDIRNEVEPHLKWIIGRGDIDSCLDRWFSIRLPMLPERVSVNNFFIIDKKLNYEYVSNLFGPQSCDMIQREQVSLCIHADKLWWIKNGAGHFTIKSAWELVRQKNVHSFTFKNLWHKNRPLKISIFLWKLLQKGSPSGYFSLAQKHSLGFKM